MKKVYFFKKFLFFSIIIAFIFLSILKSFTVKAREKTPVVINEIFYDPPQSGTDSDYEWIELYNNTSEEITLINWTISDAQGTDIIPELIIPPESFAIVAAKEKFKENYNPEGLNIVYLNGAIGNGLSNNGDRLILKNNNGEVIDQLSYGSDRSLIPYLPDVAEGHSLERCPFGIDTDSENDFIDQKSPTPGIGILPNQPPVAYAGNDQKITLGQTVNFSSYGSYDPDGKITYYYWDFGDGTDSEEPNPSHCYESVGQYIVTLEVTDDSGATSCAQIIVTVNWPSYSQDILINEILPNPSGNEESDEFIELWNKGNTAVDLKGWKLIDGSGSYYIISTKNFSSTIIPPGGFFVLYRDITKIALNNSGSESLILLSPDGQEKDKVSYSGGVKEDYSYNRTSFGWQWSNSPTPGTNNVITIEEDESHEVISKFNKNKSNRTKTKTKSTKTTLSKNLPSILGARVSNTEKTNLPRSYHFSEAVNKEKDIRNYNYWRVLLWFLMIFAFLLLIFLRLTLWIKKHEIN